MKTISPSKPPSQPVDFQLAVHITPRNIYEWSGVLLARANFNGTLELLTVAWQRVLGYGRDEFDGKTLGHFLWSRKTAAADAVAAILDERNMDPVDLTVRCRSGEAKPLRLHRRLDAYTHEVFIVAEERSNSRDGEPVIP